MKIFFIIAAIVYIVQGNSETTCEDSSFLCRIPSYVTEYSCKYFTETKSNCPKSCGICTGYCSRVESYSRQQCGTSGTTASQCHSRGCCWNPTYDGSGTPWCFSVKSDYDVECSCSTWSVPVTTGVYHSSGSVLVSTQQRRR